MKNIISIIICIFLLILIIGKCEAKLYVCVDKTTNEPRGVTDIDDASRQEWENDFLLIDAVETLRGKQGYEIKITDGKATENTKEAISQYRTQMAERAERENFDSILKMLGITNDQLKKIKDNAK